jgi:hypothetical protein
MMAIIPWPIMTEFGAFMAENILWLFAAVLIGIAFDILILWMAKL